MTIEATPPAVVTDRPDAAAPQRRRPVIPASLSWQRAVVVTALLATAALTAVNLGGWPAFWDDEGTYTSQAWAVRELGTLAPYTYWYDHPPLGWLQLAVVSWLPGLLPGVDSPILAARVVMVALTVVTGGLLYMLARRCGLTFGFSLLAMLAWGLSPLVMYHNRQVLLDNIATTWLLAACVMALNRRQHLGLHMLSGICFAVAVLSKETTALFAPALLVALWQSAYRGTRRFAFAAFGVLLTLVGSLYLLYAVIKNELVPGDGHVSLIGSLQYQLVSRAGSDFILTDGTPANLTLDVWLGLDWYLLAAGLVAAAPALFVRRLRVPAVACLLSLVVALRPDGYLPTMYVIAVMPFLAVTAAGMVDVVWRAARRIELRPVSVVASALVLAVVAAGVWQTRAWLPRWEHAFTTDDNELHEQALAQLDGVPRDAVIVSDNAYWNDLVAEGRPRDKVIWFFKIDNDPQVTRELPTYDTIDYVIATPDLRTNATRTVWRAIENSDVVWSYQTVDGPVQVLRVLSPEQKKQRDAEVAAALAQDQRRTEERMRAPSQQWPELTNGQVAAIREEGTRLSREELAGKYDVSAAVVDEVLG